MRLQAIIAAFAAFAPVLPAQAAGFTPPRGCQTVLTVQHKSCSVTLQWQCDDTTEGDFWAATFSSDGLESIVGYTADYQWLDAFYAWDGSRETFTPPAADPVSLKTLIETGIDTYDFNMRRTQGDRSYNIRVVGADELIGETTRIDGYELDLVRTRIEITAEDGTVEYRSEGTQYLSRPLGQFFLGTERVFDEDGTVTEYDDSPVDIIEAGEPGFGATTPIYDCSWQDARLTPPAPVLEGTNMRRQMTEANAIAAFAPKDGET